MLKKFKVGRMSQKLSKVSKLLRPKLIIFLNRLLLHLYNFLIQTIGNWYHTFYFSSCMAKIFAVLVNQTWILATTSFIKVFQLHVNLFTIFVIVNIICACNFVVYRIVFCRVQVLTTVTVRPGKPFEIFPLYF